MQSFNFQGISFLSRILVHPSLAIPHIEVKDLREIDPERLARAGIKGIVFDKDNTLTEPYQLNIFPDIAESLKEFKKIFGGKMVILSNSAGTLDDPNYEKADRIERALEIAVLRHRQKKPGKIVELENYFESNTQELVIIGDRYLTDVAYGNRYGMFAAHVQPFTTRGDNPLVKIIRPLEKLLVEIWRKSGVIAPKHSVQERYQQFIL